MGREQLKMEVVRNYYFDDMNQFEIAKKLNISRSYVSKLLIEARKEKLIEIRSSNPWLMETEEERHIRTKYGLKKAIIVSRDSKAYRDEIPYTEEMGRVLNNFLNTILKDGDVIGVAWGKTIFECSKYLHANKKYKDIKIVQICGGVSRNQNSTYASEISKNFTNAYQANSYHLPLPAIVESRVYKDIFCKEQGISQIIRLLDRVNIAIFTVGQCSPESSLIRSGYITQNGIRQLIDNGAVGEVCTHFISADGECVDQELDDRTVAASISQLKSYDYRIALILGKQRLEPLKAILKSSCPNVLIIDEETASVLMEDAERGK